MNLIVSAIIRSVSMWFSFTFSFTHSFSAKKLGIEMFDGCLHSIINSIIAQVLHNLPTICANLFLKFLKGV